MRFKVSGIGWMLWAGLAFTLMNIGVKMVKHLPIGEIIIARAGVQMLISFWIAQRLKLNVFNKHSKWLVMRGVFGTIGLFCFYYTLQVLPLGNAIVVHSLSPILTTILAMVFFKEKVFTIQWLWFSLIFIGVYIVNGSVMDANIIGLIVGFLGALFSAAAYNSIKKLKGLVHPQLVVFYFPWVAIPLVSIYTLIAGETWVWPLNYEWFWLLSIGFATHLGQTFLTAAYQADDASRISPMSYLGIIWGAISGMLLFDETYAIAQYLGAGVIFIGILLNIRTKAYYAKRKG